MKKEHNFNATLKNEDLLDAVIANNALIVKKLLTEKANPNFYEDKCKIRPLHFAAVYNSTDVVFSLIKAGANVNAETSDGYKAIDIAKQLNHTEIVEALTKLSTNLVSLSEY